MPFLNAIPTDPLDPNTDLMVSAPQPEDMGVQEQPAPTQEELEKKAEAERRQANKKRWDEFRQRTDVCKLYRQRLARNWTDNIDYRRGKPFQSQTDDDNIAVNLDWTLTKAKQASLFSQTPKVRISHHPDSAAAGPWLAKFESKLNDTLVDAGIESAIDEALPDCINAAGIGVVFVAYEALTEDAEVPALDIQTLPPQLQLEALQKGTLGGQPIPTEVVPRTIAKRYVVQRISPSDFLWPVDFTGSDFDNAPWVGRSGRVPWAEAAQRFKLNEKDKETLLGEDRTVLDRLTHDIERETMAAEPKVGFDEIFYKSFQYDSDARSFEHIHHLVFINGKDDPVIDEPWQGQAEDNQTEQVIGAMRYPVRVLTLTYITDDNIPPSDSAIGRAQVDEINYIRTQMIRQRQRSMPLRWYDVNRVDPAIQFAIMRGVWQHAIPVQGDGQRVIGEVARSSFPQENPLFDQIAKRDLQETWTVGMYGNVETKGEAAAIQSGIATRIGRERARVASFFVGIARVLGGLICLYEEPQAFGEDFNPAFSRVLSYSILPDSTILVDANQRLERLNGFVNMYAKSGWVSLEPVLKEVATLVGLDPNVVIRKPEPQRPELPNISLRLTGAKDMMNPLTLAFMIKTGQAPEQQLVEQAKQLIQQAVIEAQPPQPGPGTGPTGAPLPPGAPLPTQVTPRAMPAPPPGTPLPPVPPPPVGGANPQMSILPSLVKRSDTP